ncbi:MAG: tryptophan-rich sensory protein [Bacteroidota bacterium]
MKKIYAILNLFLILGLIYWNYLTNTLNINGNTVGSLSREYANLFTPAGYAFSIWGIIFIGLIVLGVQLVRMAFGGDEKDGQLVVKIGPWLLLANLANCAWLWFWLTEWTGTTVLIMTTILFALHKLVVEMKMATASESKVIRRTIWTPISLYAGWISVATIANVTAYLAKIDWQFLLSETAWTILLIAVADVLFISFLLFRNMWVYTAVGVWALLAIASRHSGSMPILQYAALGSAILLLGMIAWHLLWRRKNAILP